MDIQSSIVTPRAIQALQQKLYLKAKQEPNLRFYALYDKLCRPDILAYAYALARSNGGAPGVDGVSFEDVARTDTHDVPLMTRRAIRRCCCRPW